MASRSRSNKAKDKDETKGKGRGSAEEGDEHGTKDVSAALAELESGWGETEEKKFGDVPDGKYQVKIEAARVNHSKQKGRLQCSWELTIQDTDHRGRRLFKHDGMDNEESLGWFRGGLARLGVEWPDTPKKIPGALEDLIGTYAQVTARTKEEGGIQNVYFDKALDDDDITEPVTDEDAGDGKGKGGKKTAAAEEPEEKPTGKKDAEKEKENEADGEEGVNPTFEEKDTKPLKKKIEALAKENTFDPGDYENTTDLLCDVAEYAGIKGDFDDAQDLFDLTVKKIAKKK